MEQSIRPVDPYLFIGLGGRPLEVTHSPHVLAEREPYIKLAVHGFLHFPPDESCPTATTVILGVRYTYNELQVLENQAIRQLHANDTFEMPSPDDPIDRMVMRLMIMNASDRRMTYRWLLEGEMRLNDDPRSELGRFLRRECALWEMCDQREMHFALDRGLEHPLKHLMRSSPGECWLWKKPLVPGRPLPVISSWRGMKYVSVHRLLWPIVRPDDPFKPGSRPVRRKDMCTSTVCVNPRHFDDSSRLAKARVRGPGRGYVGVARTANRIPWGMENAHPLGDGRFELRCPRCQTPASGRYQDYVNHSYGNRVNGGVMYCSACYQTYREFTNMFTQQHALRMPDLKRGETAIERSEREFREATDPNDGWPEWTYPERDMDGEGPADPA